MTVFTVSFGGEENLKVAKFWQFMAFDYEPLLNVLFMWDLLWSNEDLSVPPGWLCPRAIYERCYQNMEKWNIEFAGNVAGSWILLFWRKSFWSTKFLRNLFSRRCFWLQPLSVSLSFSPESSGSTPAFVCTAFQTKNDQCKAEANKKKNRFIANPFLLSLSVRICGKYKVLVFHWSFSHLK